MSNMALRFNQLLLWDGLGQSLTHGHLCVHLKISCITHLYALISTFASGSCDGFRIIFQLSRTIVLTCVIPTCSTPSTLNNHRARPMCSPGNILRKSPTNHPNSWCKDHRFDKNSPRKKQNSYKESQKLQTYQKYLPCLIPFPPPMACSPLKATATCAVCCGLSGSRTMRRMKSLDNERSIGASATARVWKAHLGSGETGRVERWQIVAFSRKRCKPMGHMDSISENTLSHKFPCLRIWERDYMPTAGK